MFMWSLGPLFWWSTILVGGPTAPRRYKRSASTAEPFLAKRQADGGSLGVVVFGSLTVVHIVYMWRYIAWKCEGAYACTSTHASAWELPQIKAASHVCSVDHIIDGQTHSCKFLNGFSRAFFKTGVCSLYPKHGISTYRFQQPHVSQGQDFMHGCKQFRC